MKIDSGESLLYSYLRHVKKCYIVQTNWKPSGNWAPEPRLMEKVKGEYERIQRHKFFTEVFKTDFEHTIRQAEVDVLGIDQNDTIYAVNVAFNELGINYGSKTDTRNRVVKNLLRAHLALQCYFPDKQHVLVFCSPKVSASADEIILNYFKVLESDFDTPQTKFLFIGNNDFRDLILMETLECIQDEFDTNELFLRSFKLLTLYARDLPEDSSEETTPATPEVAEDNENIPQEELSATVSGEGKKKISYSEGDPGTEVIPAESYETSSGPGKPVTETRETTGEEPMPPYTGENTSLQETPGNPDDNEKVKNEILKVLARVPKWFKKPEQNNSKILIAYMELLEKSENISLAELMSACPGVTKFMSNYAQMINVANINHGKVFNSNSEKIELWEPVKEFIIQEYIQYKKAYYDGR